MKRASTILLMSLGLASLCSCCIDTSGLGYPMRYDFSFIFLDADGNNLAEGIDIVDQNPRNVPREDATFGVVSDKGTRLDIILSNPGDKYDNNNYREIGFFPDTPYGLPEPETQPYFVYKKVGGISLIANDFVLFANACEPQEILTYQIVCPYIFGDDDVHAVTTYWKEQGKEDGMVNKEYFMECYKVEFEGKVINDINHDWERLLYESNSVAITIDR